VEKGLEGVVMDLTNQVVQGHSSFIGVNYQEQYHKLNKDFKKNTMFILKKKEINPEGYKLSIYGSVEFSELN